MIIKRDGNSTKKQARICHYIRAIKDQGVENFSFEVIKTVDYIDTYHLLIIENCCMDEYDSINNGYNTKHSVCMFDLY
jgi:hypothetical protein